jgi:hypothetical protein
MSTQLESESETINYYSNRHDKIVKTIIYKITNKLNGKSYIGQVQSHRERTKNGKPYLSAYGIKERWSCHQRHALVGKGNGAKSNNPLHFAIDADKPENFSIIEVENCYRELADKREQYWIAKECTLVPKGYNSDIGGNSSASNSSLHRKIKEFSDLGAKTFNIKKASDYYEFRFIGPNIDRTYTIFGDELERRMNIITAIIAAQTDITKDDDIDAVCFTLSKLDIKKDNGSSSQLYLNRHEQIDEKFKNLTITHITISYIESKQKPNGGISLRIHSKEQPVIPKIFGGKSATLQEAYDSAIKFLIEDICIITKNIKLTANKTFETITYKLTLNNEIQTYLRSQQ